MTPNESPDGAPARGWDMSVAEQATILNWLQARYLEQLRDVEVVRKYDATGEVAVGVEDRQQAVVPTAVFHKFLEAKLLPVAMTVDHCLEQDWIQEILRIGPANFKQKLYGIQPRVMQAVVERPKQVERKPAVDTVSLPDGPSAPNRFSWQGRTIELSPKSWGVVNLLWNLPKRVAPKDEVCVAVWGDEEAGGGALRGAISRANTSLLKAEIPLQIKQANRYVMLEILDGT